ncbi:MAG: methylenetetrahydrofolate reductase [NAD(P)H] [Actinobacteria bacterium]|uniref:methylenetetrahydrofolate reductase (NADH) n=1 Tax=freshwater metagenome TaxID=449393 RepID=A0A6J7S8A9_9ZZZZ|nr:methylenetetrahydrofolate reductase [NAD(P)H] [Actinomycetota bacterium]MTB27645.1 methylenetetrahydrofolate reductase [NAD(P)H] [Actinomycetota bacterium]
MTHPAGGPDLGTLLAQGGRSFSFELFPPKTDEGERALWQTVRDLERLHPTFVSVTYGAGGSTRDRTVRITAEIAEQTSMVPVAHLTCVGASREELRGVIAEYADAGITTILALRGDPPGGPTAGWTPHPDGLQHADELVELIKSLGNFTVGVAAFPEGHPSSPDLDTDARVLAAKQDAGAEFAVTQFFFRSRDYADLLERASAHGVSMPIIPGLMPVTNVAQISRFAELSGAAFPPELAARFEVVKADDDAVRKLGVEIAVEISNELLDMGAPGLHFYTLNRSTSTVQVYEALGLGSR